ncbi:hypothetical protein MPS_4738 [Mycobacterium pseudoshottsii JCM 15466]|nr:hypothetical protein MPS_4738 [Mycobacterium pseudoshottsii JCM 15466]
MASWFCALRSPANSPVPAAPIVLVGEGGHSAVIYTTIRP